MCHKGLLHMDNKSSENHPLRTIRRDICRSTLKLEELCYIAISVTGNTSK